MEGDHYASILNKDKSKYTHIEFSYEKFYPSATSQLFPFIYEVINPFENNHSYIIYEQLGKYWKWKEMDYFKKKESSFYWGNFALFAAVFKDQEKFDKYLLEYEIIVENGRKYPLYSSETGMILLGLKKMINYINIEKEKKSKEHNLNENKNYVGYIFLAIGIVVLILLLGYIFYAKRKRNKEKENIEFLLNNKNSNIFI